MAESWFRRKESVKTPSEPPSEHVPEPSPELEPTPEPIVEPPKPKKRGFGLFRQRTKSSEDSTGSKKKGGFGKFGKKSSTPLPQDEPQDELEDEGEEEERELADEAADLEVEEIEEKEGGFEDSMRNTLRSLGVEVEDDDDWKQMVIKTRLTLQDIKDQIMGKKGTKEERTKKTIVVINDDNVLEIQFRLDFSHWTPPDLEITDPDEIEIPPDMSGLETPVNPEKVMAKKKRLKRIIKAITKAQKLNKKRLRRLEAKRVLKEKEELELAEQGVQVGKDGDEGSAEEGSGEREEGEKKEGKEGEEEEDTRDILEKIEDDTGIRIEIKTEKLEARIHDALIVPLMEYKEIFFGPDLTEEETAELEKIASDEKNFYVHLKFIVRKKTWEEKEAERIAAEEEAARKAAEEAEEAGEKGENEEDIVLEEGEERRRELRKEMEEENEKIEEKEEGQEETESITSSGLNDSIAYDAVPIVN